MKFAVLDFETTGSQAHDEIIQIGIVIIHDNEIIDRYSTYVNPNMVIPPVIVQLTGINNETVADAPTLDIAVSQFQAMLTDCVLVAHSVSFDLAFLQRTLLKHHYSPFNGRILDTLDALRILYPGIPSLQLSMACSALGIAHERPHQADCDAEATAQIWLQCLTRLKNLPLLTIQRLSHILDSSVTDVYDLGWFMNEMRLLKELTTPLDLDNGKYFRQFAINVNDWAEEQPTHLEAPESSALDAKFGEFYGLIKQQLQQKFVHYEERAAQEQMIDEVYASYEKNRHLMIEAGTGTGKSLGYLIPTIFYGLLNEKKMVVSTHTINLQEQIRQRDIPLLQEIFPVPFRASVLKGRNHYLCLRKFEQKINGKDYEDAKDNATAAAQMIVWLGETKHGDEEELYFGNKSKDFWRSVESDTDSCLNRACPWFKKCFYHRAKHEANVADVVITNHSLLFMDVKAENRLLPAYEHLVIDEAHHFEEVASKHMGLDLRYSSFINQLFRLYKDSRIGFLPTLRLRLQKNEGNESAVEWCKVIDLVYPKLIAVREEWDRLTEQLYAILTNHHDNNQNETNQYVLRLKQDRLPAHWGTLHVVEDNIYVELTSILKKLDKLILDIKESQEEFDLQSVITDLSGAVKDVYRARDDLRYFMKMSDENVVYWLEASSIYKNKSLQLMCVPLDVSPMLQHHFFDVKESVVMTSATLSVDQSFEYSRDQLGLELSQKIGKLKTVKLPPAFNYRKQALVCIPRDFPTVKGNGDTYFIEKLIESLRDVAIQTKGNMLVLFTSYRMLKLTHEGLTAQLLGQGIQVLGQGIDSNNRSKLTRMFKEGKGTVLLGTSSFWEGIDIPGEALSCLAIVRLPFHPPTHPLIEAKCEMITKQKKNPFMSLSLPQAVIRFKQGFGRLVRTASDKGIVIIYDTRVIDTRYGKFFIYSLPGPKIEHMATGQMVPRIRQWMDNVEGEET